MNEEQDYVEQNGVRVYRKGKRPDFPEELTKSPKIVSRFGFKIVTVKGQDGKEALAWMAASEQDFRSAEAKRLGIKEEAVRVKTQEEFLDGGCTNDGPVSCTIEGCIGPQYCGLVWVDPDHSYCTCISGET